MPEAVVLVHVSRTERPDSIEIGTPGKGGAVKVFFDAGDLDEARRRVANALILCNEARITKTRLESGGAPQAATAQGGAAP